MLSQVVENEPGERCSDRKVGAGVDPTDQEQADDNGRDQDEERQHGRSLGSVSVVPESTRRQLEDGVNGRLTYERLFGYDVD
jgi:hypothetical protein